MDENFVYKVLLPKLENEMGFRLCIHHRDFTPGEGKFHLSYTSICDIVKDLPVAALCFLDKFQLPWKNYFRNSSGKIIIFKLRCVHIS